MPLAILDLSLSQLVETYPGAREILVSQGISLCRTPELLASYGPLLKLRTVLSSRGIDPEPFCRLVEERCVPLRSPDCRPPVNLLALLPCPLKVPLELAFHNFLSALPDVRRAEISFCIEANANTQLDYADYADHFHSLDEIPDIVITPGFNSFFHPPFVERFIRQSRFTSVSAFAGDRHLSALGVVDPGGHYTMLAMNLLVLVVNRARLGERAVPRRWEDLLAPELEKSLAIRGSRDGSFCETLLLAMLQELGESGVQRLGQNVRYGWHPSQMVKAALGGNADAPAVSVMPLFFAQNLRHRAGIEVVWPEDGALVSPVTMLVKTEKLEPLADLISFLAGPEVAAICAGACFPALHPEVDNRLPEGARFKWIGWEYLEQNDLRELIPRANRLFRHGFEETQG